MRKFLVAIAVAAFISAVVDAHSNLISPKPRNAIDSNDPRWAGGKSPDKWSDKWSEVRAVVFPFLRPCLILLKNNHKDKRPCACRNGTSICDVGQTCLWMGVVTPTSPSSSSSSHHPSYASCHLSKGCSIGCKECDGGIINGNPVGANPNSIDRCRSGMNATINDPLLRTTNREVTVTPTPLLPC